MTGTLQRMQTVFLCARHAMTGTRLAMSWENACQHTECLKSDDIGGIRSLPCCCPCCALACTRGAMLLRSAAAGTQQSAPLPWSDSSSTPTILNQEGRQELMHTARMLEEHRGSTQHISAGRQHIFAGDAPCCRRPRRSRGSSCAASWSGRWCWRRWSRACPCWAWPAGSPARAA